jgi:hypothetical protein
LFHVAKENFGIPAATSFLHGDKLYPTFSAI